MEYNFHLKPTNSNSCEDIFFQAKSIKKKSVVNKLIMHFTYSYYTLHLGQNLSLEF